jgi:rhodanese-related sulfurtransferase
MSVPEIDVHELARLREQGATLLDVRNPDEWLEARVPGVPLIPLPDLAERTDEVPAGDPLYVICAAGGRSAKAAEHLRTLGVDAVNVAGGTRAWIEAGYPTESGSS